MSSLRCTNGSSVFVFVIAGLIASALSGCFDDSGIGGGGGGRAGTGAAAGAAGTGGAAGGAGGTGTPGTGGRAGTTGTGGTAVAAGATGTGGSAGGGTAGTTGAGGVAGTGGSPGSGGFPPVTDFAAPGPFAVTQTSGGPSCTIYRPTDAALGGPNKDLKHPVITWGNGTGATPSVYAGVLRHWATHGFIVTASNSTNTGDAVEMIDCLEWILEQNTVSGPYMGRVDATKIGASGHSQGGGGTLMTGRDARIIATAPLQPYILGGLGGFQTSSIAQQKAPMFLMSGSDDTIATPSLNQQPVFDDTNVPVFWGTLQGATHTGTAIGSIGDYRGPATAWFRLHLMGDESARRLFYGASCDLCTSSNWQVQRKGIQ